MLSAMQYPHWLMVAGAVLVAIGFIGLAFAQNRNVEPDHNSTETKANGKREGRDSNVTTLPPWPWRPQPQAALNPGPKLRDGSAILVSRRARSALRARPTGRREGRFNL